MDWATSRIGGDHFNLVCVCVCVCVLCCVVLCYVAVLVSCRVTWLVNVMLLKSFVSSVPLDADIRCVHLHVVCRAQQYPDHMATSTIKQMVPEILESSPRRATCIQESCM